MVILGSTLTRLNYECLDVLLPGNGYPEKMIYDFRNVGWVEPSGAVCLLLLLHYLHESGIDFEILLPKHNSDVMNYLERIDFFRKTESIVDYNFDILFLRHNRRLPSQNFTEIISSQDNYSSLIQIVDVFMNFVDQHPFPLGEKRKLREVMVETFQNIQHHANPFKRAMPFYCMQIQRYRDRMCLSLGDLGVGIKESFRNSPNHHFTSDYEAIEAVLTTKISRLEHEDADRGGGLKRVYELSRTLARTFILRSGQGAIVSFSNGQVQKFSCLKYFPGTQIILTALG